MDRFYKTKAIAGIVVGSLFVLANISQLSGVVGPDAATYRNVYHISATNPEWRFASVENFQAYYAIIAAISLSYVLLNILFLILAKKPKWLKAILIIIEVFAILSFVAGLFQWAASGFDH